MKPGQPARSRRWRATPRGKFSEARRRARQRGIEFHLTFNEWWRIWDESGRWAERGTHDGGYVMRRYGDRGAYELGNVFIGSHLENVREAWINARVLREAAEHERLHCPDYD